MELLHFDPHRRRQFFPAIIDFDAVEAVLAEDIDSGDIFRRTRLPGAIDPEHIQPAAEPEVKEQPWDDAPETAPPGRLRARADLASRRGNQVRAAILRWRAVSISPPSQAGNLRGAARQDIERLVGRLRRRPALPSGRTGRLVALPARLARTRIAGRVEP